MGTNTYETRQDFELARAKRLEALNPNTPIPLNPVFTPDKLMELAVTLESWAAMRINRELTRYYRKRAAYYRAEAVRRTLAQVL